MEFLAGSGCTTINPKIGTGIAGQLYYRVCRRIHDNLEANCLFLTDGRVRILLISCDLPGLDMKRRSPARLTIVSEVTGGYSHYCPTSQAILGRGFSAQANLYLQNGTVRRAHNRGTVRRHALLSLVGTRRQFRAEA